MWGVPITLFSVVGAAAAGPESHDSPPVTALVKNDRSYTATPPYIPSRCIYEQHNFTVLWVITVMLLRI
jgi:hypothetical protein